MERRNIPVSARQTAKALGTSSNSIMAWYRAGYFPAEIAEGRLFRFDVEKVRAALALRATRHQATSDWVPPQPEKPEVEAPRAVTEPEVEPSSGFWGPRRGKRA
jgi:predicted DNA-binding transcriptional regulator AlpA